MANGDASDPRTVRIQRVVESYRQRCDQGESVDENELLALHPDLLPELSDELRRLRLINEARKEVDLEADALTRTEFRMDDTRPVFSPDDLPDVIGKYRVIGALDQGGQAVVLRVAHPALGKELLLKMSRSPIKDTDLRHALVSEGRVLAELDHPGLARVYDLDVADRHPYLVMEYVRGRNLRQLAQAQPLAERAAAALVANVARTLGYLHARGIVHHDIKPENIVVDDAGAPRIIDFGLARLRHFWTADADRAGGISGTVQFMAPEQARGETDQIDQRSDVFALGGVLYWLLVGKPPFTGDNFPECLARAQACDFDAQALARARVHRRLERICLKAMALRPRDRFATAEELAAELEKLVATDRRRGRRLVVATTVFVTACLATWMGRRFFSPSAVDTIAPGGRIDLELIVVRGDKTLDFEDVVPLQTGDRVQIRFAVPNEYDARLLWWDADGKLNDLTGEVQETRSDGRVRQLVWPSEYGSKDLLGAPGAEVIAVCARQPADPKQDSTNSPRSQRKPWPKMRDDLVLYFDEHGVQPNSSERGPGSVTHELPDAAISRAVKDLQQALLNNCELIEGVVFPHVEGTARTGE